MIATLVAGLQHGMDRVRRRLSALHPARRRAEKALSKTQGSRLLPETGELIPRRFGRQLVYRPGSGSSSRVDVSVIIPIYNTERWLDDCLESVLAQTGVSVEVLCVNDGSTDASRSVIERYVAGDARIRIIDQMNSGQSVARNTGLGEARGRYIIYIDSDDLWVDDNLAALVRRADEEALDVLFFEGVGFRDGRVDGEVWNRYAKYYPRSRAYRRRRTGPRMLADMRAHQDYRVHVGMYIARTSYVRDSGVRFIPGIVHQDNPYTFTLILRARRVAHTRTYFYARRLRPGSTITSLQTRTSATGYFVSALAMRREVAEHDLDSRAEHETSEVLRGILRSARAQYSQLSGSDMAAVGALDGSDEGRRVAVWLASSGNEDIPPL